MHGITGEDDGLGMAGGVYRLNMLGENS